MISNSPSYLCGFIIYRCELRLCLSVNLSLPCYYQNIHFSHGLKHKKNDNSQYWVYIKSQSMGERLGPTITAQSFRVMTLNKGGPLIKELPSLLHILKNTESQKVQQANFWTTPDSSSVMGTQHYLTQRVEPFLIPVSVC